MLVIVLYRCLEKKLFIVSHRKPSLHSVWTSLGISSAGLRNYWGWIGPVQRQESPAGKACASLFVCFIGECSSWHFANSAF